VFWVHASNAARFEQSFRDIADQVKVVGRRDPQANIFKLVHDWLCNSRQRWLLVLDNVDDAQFLLSGEADGHGQGQTTTAQVIRKPLREYLPHCERGSILVTTRNKEAARNLVEQRDIISVEPMDEAQALALFKKKLGVEEDDGDIVELAAALEYMPLALVQAAAYIWQSAPRCSVAQYLKEFRRSESEKTSLLDHEAGQLRRDPEAKNAIIITWQISFEHLRHYKPTAAGLLSLMSFFDRQGIPETLIHGGRRVERASTASDRREKSTRQRLRVFFNRTKSEPDAQRERRESDGDGVNFNNDVRALRDLCFVSVNTDGATFEMHSLVQLATRRWLTANGKLERWKHQFISNLCAEFPTGKYENWAACQALFAHAKAALEHQPHDVSMIADWATVLYRAAWYAESIGSIADAVRLATKALQAREKVLGYKHEDTLRSIAMVADAYSLAGRWDEAEKLRKQVMETRKKKLGADHPDTLTSMANLASTLWNQGRWDAAEELEVQVMETSKKKLGADHPDTLTIMANLASTYRNQGRWDAAEELFVQVIETRKKKLGADHPSTLTSMNSLAFTWKAQGRITEAVVLMRQCVQQRQQVLKASHPDLKSSLAALEEWEAK
jgi:tetratricopeptide (TPR) repeat protein